MSLTVTRKAQTCYTQDVRNPQPGTLSLMSAAATACRALAASLILLVGARSACHAQPCCDPPQIPLCMIGDSITWAGEGDHWRRLLLERLPRLAFVGTHSACLGYSHAGEGGNSTGTVITRLADLPDCPYYSLEIGTNDNSITDPAQMEDRAAQTAQRIIDIVNGLLAKPCTRKVFLGSVLPCHTDNPLRDQTNSATNKVLRERFEDLGVEVHYTTEDGSFGERGVVTAPVEEFLGKHARRGVVLYACGPWGMMKAADALARRYDVPCEVSLEARMGCSLGACMGCVVRVRQEEEYVRVCQEGPVMDSRIVDWETPPM